MRITTHFAQALSRPPKPSLHVETQITQVVSPSLPPLYVETQVTQIVSAPPPPEHGRVSTHFVQTLSRARSPTLHVETQLTQIVSRGQSATRPYQTHEKVLLRLGDASMSAPAQVRQVDAKYLFKLIDDFQIRVHQEWQHTLLDMAPYIQNSQTHYVHEQVLLLPLGGIPRTTRTHHVHSNALLQVEAPDSVEPLFLASHVGQLVVKGVNYPDPMEPVTTIAVHQVSITAARESEFMDKDIPQSGLQVNLVRRSEVIPSFYIDKDIPQSHARVAQIGQVTMNLLEKINPMIPQSQARVTLNAAMVASRWATLDPDVFGADILTSQVAIMAAVETSLDPMLVSQVELMVLQPTDAYPDPILFGSTIEVEHLESAIVQELTLLDPTVPQSHVQVSQVGVTFSQPYELFDPTVPITYLEVSEVALSAMSFLETFNAHVDHSYARTGSVSLMVGQPNGLYPDPTIDQSVVVVYQHFTMIAQDTFYLDKDMPQSHAHISDVGLMIAQDAKASYPHPGKPGRFGPQTVVGYVPRG